MQEKLKNQQSILSNTQDNKALKLINFHDILKTENIEHYKILAFLIVEDSLPNSNIYDFFIKFSKVINDHQNVAIAKIKMIEELVANEKIYLDCVLEIIVDVIYVILVDKKITYDQKIIFFEKINKELIFISEDKNEIGRIYGQEERLIKLISRLMQLIAPDKSDISDNHDFLHQTKKEIYTNLQNFLLFHLSRARDMFEKIITKNENNIFIINQQTLLENNHNQDSLTIEDNRYIQKVLNILNEEKLIIKNKLEFFLIVIAIIPYEIAVPLILGVADYSMLHIQNVEIQENFIIAKNHYRELYFLELKNSKKNFEISKLGQKAKVFFNKAKEEIEISNDQLNATANLIKSNSQE